VSGHMHKWIGKQIGTARHYCCWFEFYFGIDVGIAIFYQIGQRSRIGIPITATAVF